MTQPSRATPTLTGRDLSLDGATPVGESVSGQRAWLTGLREVWPSLKPDLGDLAIASVFVNLLALAMPIFALQVYDRVVFYQGLSTLQALAIGMGVVILFEFAFRNARSRMLQRAAVNIDARLGSHVFDHIQALPLRTLENRPSARWSAMFGEVEQVRNTFAGPPAVTLMDLPFVILFLAMIGFIAPPVLPVLVVSLCVFIILAIAAQIWVGGRARGERRQALARDGAVDELAHARATFKALGAETFARRVWRDRHAQAMAGSNQRGRAGDFMQNLAQSAQLTTMVAITTVGALAIVNQQMSVGSLIASNLLAGRMIQPLVGLIGSWRQVGRAREALGRLAELFSLPREAETPGLAGETVKGRIQLDNVSFAYETDGPLAIDRLSLAAGPGGYHVIMGRNGSGKTTLLRLMRGLYPPAEGRVLLDGADIAQFTSLQLAGWIGFMPQEATLIAGTIRDNISLARPDSPERDVLEAAEIAGAHEFIAALPEGYDSDIGEAGRRLSAGQRQKLALARAVLGRPPVILFDEPTSHLDDQATVDLVARLRELSASHTLVMVSHTPAVIDGADTITVLEGGRAAIAGPAMQVRRRLGGTLTPRPRPVETEGS